MTERTGRRSLRAPDYSRIAERFEAGIDTVTDRLEGLADRMDARLARIERDLASGEQDRGSLHIEMRELRRDVGELRESVQLHEAHETRQAAEGAAAGAVRAASQVSGRPITIIGLVGGLLVIGEQIIQWGPKLLQALATAIKMSGNSSD